MLSRFARLATRHSRPVLISAVLFVVLAGAFGGGVAENLTAGGFVDPATESAQAEEILDDRFDTGVPNVVLVVTARAGNVDTPAVTDAGLALTEELAAEDHVTNVVSYWSEGGAPPCAATGRPRLVIARIPGDDDQVEERITEPRPRYQRDGVIVVEVGGYAQVFHDIGETLEEDLPAGRDDRLPITLILLVVIFGSVVAATLPLIVGVMSIIGTFLVLQIMSGVTDVSIYALNLTTASASASPSTTACSWCPGSGRSCGPATSPGGRRGRSARPGGRWRSAP